LETDDGMDDNNTDSGRWKWWVLLVILITLLVFIGIGYGLYQLGGIDQAPLERLRDIAIIFLIFQLLLVSIILGGLAAGLVFLIIVLKDQIIPLLSELTETAKRLRGTTEFMTEEAVKPIIKSAGQAAKWRATVRAITGQDRPRQ
jgi:hypothetical protein